MKAFILAGGFATRLWPLTEKRAKPLLPIAGKPILTHLVEKIPQNIPVTVSTNAAFSEAFGKWKEERARPDAVACPTAVRRGRGKRKVDVVIEETRSDDEKLGALGATAQWIERYGIQEDLLLLTGDNYLGFSMENFLSTYTPGTPLLAAFDIGDRNRAKAFGTVITDPGDAHRIIAFEEKPKEPKTTLVSTGCSVLPADTLPILVEYAKHHPDNVGGIFEHLLSIGRAVECFTFTEPWLDIGSFGAYLSAHRLVLVGKHVIAGSSRAPKTILRGSIAIGEGSLIEESDLEDTMIFDHCRIHNCVLKECVIDDHCILEGVDLRGKMIREGTILRAER